MKASKRVLSRGTGPPTARRQEDSREKAPEQQAEERGMERGKWSHLFHIQGLGLRAGGDDSHEMATLARGPWHAGEPGAPASRFGEPSAESRLSGLVPWCNGGWLAVRNRSDKYLGNKRHPLVRLVWFPKGRRCGVAGYRTGYAGEAIRRLVHEKLVYGVYDVLATSSIAVMAACRVNAGKRGLDATLQQF